MRVHISNARNSHSAHVALDASGRFLISVDLSGRICWATPQALALLDGSDSGNGETVGELPAEAADWLRGYLLEVSRNAPGTNDVIAPMSGLSLRFSYAGQISSSEHLLRVTEVVGGSPSDILRKSFDLTGREAEVLTWIANGKSNKEIAAILEMSPRTVNKHLDRIFGKLGVENRTSAAVVSLKRLLKG